MIIALGQLTRFRWTTRMHQTEGLPIMLMAGFGELLKSSLTDFSWTLHAIITSKPDGPSRLGEVNVRFGWTTLLNKDVAGLAEIVPRFRRG